MSHSVNCVQFLRMLMRFGVMAALVLLLAACRADTLAPAPTAQVATASEVVGTVPANAIVTLLPASGAPPMPAEPALMDQLSKQFIPPVLLARVGQPVAFHNGEDLPHNVTVIRRISGTEMFNTSTERGQTFTYTFDRAGQYDVRCDIHEGMEAILIVAHGPVTTIAEDDGRFVLHNVPFGSYRLSLTYAGQTVEQPLEVSGARTEVNAR